MEMNENNSRDCGMVQDLLPLYVDDVCSEESKAFVANHVANCGNCAGTLARLRNTQYVDRLQKEESEVVYQHAKKQKRRSAVVGAVFAGILMIPVVICMAVNLFVGHGLDWFFIVLASLMIVASISVVPLMVADHKGPWTFIAFTGSLDFLFAVINILTHGTWFWIAGFATTFGLSLVFMPFVIQAVKEGFWSRHKALAVYLIDTGLFVLMMLSIGLKANSGLYWSIAGAITLVVFGYLWLMLWILRYLKVEGPTKAGLAVLLTGLVSATGENLVFSLLGYSVVWHGIHLDDWFNYYSSNTHWFVFLASVVVAVILFIISAVRKGDKRRNEGK